ncbi:ABC transporter substrate-binding protein [Microbacterium sp. SORGH_AS_0888]|uniref:ABC transporter substrate-binding protein n=1 Tax=Microbacterium sp. SORGH_AS_0888 TaxID=3041791 RepID=UPI00278487C6|nr:ABC transporter substrate-binding protein [Microbacterium sp. SORGH_AS_0888]MDQ1129403.1 NitT/TauT family transport system substrate-binding protein [Microbacterium sp. SORGH_AS_0888]
MTHRRRAAIGLGSVAIATALVLSGCSGSSAPSSTSSDGLTKVTLQLQWVAQAQFAGYYAAAAEGYYKDEGLDVTIVPAGTDTVPINEVAKGNADYAISWVPKVLGSIEKGVNVTDVAQIFERSGTTQISFADKGITTPADLKDKKVGSWGYGNQWELFAGMQKAGIDTDSQISLVQQAFDMKGFLAGDIDAAQAMTYNEYAQVLETINPATGKLYQPSDLNVINWNDYGTAMLQDAIWADADKLKDPTFQDTTVKFIKASIKGWVYARDHAQDAADIVTKAGSTLGTSHQLWMTNEVNKLIWPSTEGIGMVRSSLWDQTVSIAEGTKDNTGATIITKAPPSTAYDNTYVTKALDELKSEGVDVMGTGFTPLTVTLNEGGN